MFVLQKARNRDIRTQHEFAAHRLVRQTALRVPFVRVGLSQGLSRSDRKRAAKEQQDFREYALSSALQSLLPILDSLELSLRHTDNVEKFRSGVELIYNQLKDALQKIGLEEIPLEGERFDPAYQHAVAVVDAPDAEDNQILEVLQHGYKLKDRVLRPAMVRVARKPHN